MCQKVLLCGNGLNNVIMLSIICDGDALFILHGQTFLEQLFTVNETDLLTLYLLCQLWSLPNQQQIKISCQKYGQMGIQVSDCVENIVGKGEIARYEEFFSFSTLFSFQKLSCVDASK